MRASSGPHVGADIALQVNSNHVFIDHTWVWRADHGVEGFSGEPTRAGSASPPTSSIIRDGQEVRTGSARHEPREQLVHPDIGLVHARLLPEPRRPSRSSMLSKTRTALSLVRSRRGRGRAGLPTRRVWTSRSGGAISR